MNLQEGIAHSSVRNWFVRSSDKDGNFSLNQKENKMTIKATKKPVTIEAVKWTGENSAELKDFCGEKVKFFTDFTNLNNCAAIETLEGVMSAVPGDFVIKGVNGEFYPCKPDIFEKTYDVNDPRQCNAINVVDDSKEFIHSFSWALEAMKAGNKIHRSGWNGKGMFAVLQKGYPEGIPCNKQTAEAWGLKEGDLFRCEPYMQLKMVNGSHSMWVPSVNDCLSNDWAIV